MYIILTFKIVEIALPTYYYFKMLPKYLCDLQIIYKYIILYIVRLVRQFLLNTILDKEECTYYLPSYN